MELAWWLMLVAPTFYSQSRRKKNHDFKASLDYIKILCLNKTQIVSLFLNDLMKATI